MFVVSYYINSSIETPGVLIVSAVRRTPGFYRTAPVFGEDGIIKPGFSGALDRLPKPTP